MSVLPEISLTLAFSAEGRVGGSAGCNSFDAPFTAEGGKLAVGPIAATRKACAVPEGVMEQEQRFLEALGKAASARLEAGRLELRSTDGSLLVSAKKAGE